MLRLVKSVEERPEHSTVINWTVPVYIKNGEDYYKVCFDIKRKPLSDGTLPMTESELIEFFSLTGRTNDGKYPIYFFKNVYIEDCGYIYADMSRRGENYEKDSGHILITNIKAILWLAERFELLEK